MKSRKRSLTRRSLGQILILATAMLMTVPIVMAQHAPKPPRKEKRIVHVRGDRAWTNTGIRLRPQDRVTLTATGKVCFSNEEKQSCVDADGWGVQSYATSWPDNCNSCDDPIKDANHAALIANVGHPDFLVGRHLTFSGKDGTLYLGINDCSFKGDYHNSGAFNVVIIIERDAVPRS